MNDKIIVQKMYAEQLRGKTKAQGTESGAIAVNASSPSRPGGSSGSQSRRNPQS